jgi:hypothetical protein
MRPPTHHSVIALHETKIALLIDYIKLLKNHIALLEISIAARLKAGPSVMEGTRAKHKLT